jgi:hypothetical protein
MFRVLFALIIRSTSAAYSHRFCMVWCVIPLDQVLVLRTWIKHIGICVFWNFFGETAGNCGTPSQCGTGNRSDRVFQMKVKRWNIDAKSALKGRSNYLRVKNWLVKDSATTLTNQNYTQGEVTWNKVCEIFYICIQCTAVHYFATQVN